MNSLGRFKTQLHRRMNGLIETFKFLGSLQRLRDPAFLRWREEQTRAIYISAARSVLYLFVLLPLVMRFLTLVAGAFIPSWFADVGFYLLPSVPFLGASLWLSYRVSEDVLVRCLHFLVVGVFLLVSALATVLCVQMELDEQALTSLGICSILIKTVACFLVRLDLPSAAFFCTADILVSLFGRYLCISSRRAWTGDMIGWMNESIAGQFFCVMLVLCGVVLGEQRDFELYRAHTKQKETEANYHACVSYILHELRNPLTAGSLILHECIARLKAEELPFCTTSRESQHDAVSRSAKEGRTHDDVENGSKQDIVSWIEGLNTMLATIGQQMGRMTLITNDALTLEKLEAGRFEFHLRPFNLFRWLLMIYDTHRLSFEVMNIAFYMRIDAGLLAKLDDRWDGGIVGDETRLEQVAVNFLSNARKFTPPGKTVTMKCQMLEWCPGVGPRLRISAQDDGAGVPQSDLSKLFKPYSQLRPADLQRGGGAGLGLSIAKAFMERHREGRTGVKSAGIDQGSEFFFEALFDAGHTSSLSPADKKRIDSTFVERRDSSTSAPSTRSPTASRRHHSENILVAADSEREMEWEDDMTGHSARHQESRDAAACSVSVTNPATPRRRKSSLPPPMTDADSPDTKHLTARVLLVEDNETVRFGMSFLLKRFGLAHHFATDDEQAVERIRAGERYSLILMDNMPIKDGITATREITALLQASGSAPIPIVGLTGVLTADVVSQYREAGAADVKGKPLTKEALGELVEEYTIIK